jgi:hypothetical protein
MMKKNDEIRTVDLIPAGMALQAIEKLVYNFGKTRCVYQPTYNWGPFLWLSEKMVPSGKLT